LQPRFAASPLFKIIPESLVLNKSGSADSTFIFAKSPAQSKYQLRYTQLPLPRDPSRAATSPVQILIQGDPCGNFADPLEGGFIFFITIALLYCLLNEEKFITKKLSPGFSLQSALTPSQGIPMGKSPNRFGCFTSLARFGIHTHYKLIWNIKTNITRSISPLRRRTRSL
jgi:hypothetical protein